MSISPRQAPALLVNKGIGRLDAVSFLIAALMTLASIVGIVYPYRIYPSDELARAFFPNDIVNLVLGVPALLISMGLTHRRSWLGFFCWAGTVYYVRYNYIAYISAISLNWAFVLHFALVVASLYILIGYVRSVDGRTVQQRLIHKVSERVSGGVLMGLGLLFFFRALGTILTVLLWKKLT